LRNDTDNKTRPWLWIPSLYFAEGLPYVMVMTLSVIFYKRMGISNAQIALYTSWLYLPWVIKPLWGPVVDILKTRRFWILAMQLIVGAGLAGVALTIPAERFFQLTMACFWLVAFSSATHDIAADGFYMLGLSKGNQSFFVGIRSTFYRIAMLTGQGLLVILAGVVEARTGLPPVTVEVRSVEGSTRAQLDTTGYRELVATGNKFLSSGRINIGMTPVSREDAETLIAAVDRWNSERGFYPPVEHENGKGKTGGLAGNVGTTWFKLAEKPAEGESIVLNFSRTKGDQSISLARSYRFEFDGSNWDQPAMAVFRLDPGLERSSEATFTGLSGNIRFAWVVVFITVALLFAAFHMYHRLVLPRPPEDGPKVQATKGFLREYLGIFTAFFRKKNIGIILAFLLVYRLGESQLVKLASPFLLDPAENGGLGLTTGDLGLVYGTVGIIALSAGGILGGIAASRKGLRYWLWWMVAAMNLPNLVYLFLSFQMPSSLWIVGSAVAFEQFGYGFGFTAYMLYMIHVSDGFHKTAHFALTTGFMALGMMIPGMVSGWLQEALGYPHFFLWVMICTIPGFLLIPFLGIDPGFGKKTGP